MKTDWEELVREMRGGSLRALSRLISGVESRSPGWMEAMKMIFADTGRAKMIGITGSPGAGKSTVTNQLAALFVQRGLTVGIIAIDPSSPFSGGALLGDRLRMKLACELDGVFIRSMATRGALGGLSQATKEVAKILDAFGKDIVIIETVGVGQDEVDVVKATDLVAVICVPGQGDSIQAIKAGIMEIADIFVVNKADREGADQVVADIKGMLDMSSADGAVEIPVLKTVATSGAGMEELSEVIMKMLDAPKRIKVRQAEHLKEEILVLMEREVSGLIRAKWNADGRLASSVEQVLKRKSDPYSVAQEMIGPLREKIS